MNNSCANNNSIILNGDNFKHSISLSDVVDGKRQLIDLSNVNIVAVYYTLDSDKKFTATKTGNTCVNCVFDSVNNRLKVIFDGYNLDNGMIHCSITISIPDNDYQSGYAMYKKIACIGVSLVDESFFTNG